MKVQGYSLPAFAAGSLAFAFAAFGAPTKRQSYQTHNLTPDGFWHNRYHALLSMAVYGDYNTLCPNQTFTEETLLNNFANATRVPWQVVSTFGPTASGAEGFTAIVPEMNKALIIFKGNYELEQTLPTNSVTWDSLNLGHDCTGCLVNAYAAQGYYEAKNETNDFQALKDVYEGAGLVFSITGHGLGGMHSQIAAIDQYQEEVDYYNHAYGSPRVFNSLGATYYHNRFDGEAGERGVANNDLYTEFIPESTNYSHAGTPFYYWGYNRTSTAMNFRICWTEDDPDYSDCMPQEQANITAEQSHYFYFSNVGQCGGDVHPDPTILDAAIASVNGSEGAFTTSASLNTSTSSTSSIPSSSSIPPTSAPVAASTTAAPAAASATTSDALVQASVSFTALAGVVLGLACLV